MGLGLGRGRGSRAPMASTTAMAPRPQSRATLAAQRTTPSLSGEAPPPSAGCADAYKLVVATLRNAKR